MQLRNEKLLENCKVHLNANVNAISVNGNVEINYSIKEKTEKITTDYLVMATPATVSSKLLNSQLSNPLGTFIKSQKYVHNIHAAYLIDEGEISGFHAYYYPCGDWDTPIGAIVFHKLKCPVSIKAPQGKELVSIYLLDEPSKAIINSNKNDHEIMNEVWEMACDFLPKLTRIKENVTIIKRREAIPLHEVGRYKQANQLKNESLGKIFFTGDYLSCATVEGGLRSGRWVASKISNKEITF